MKFIHMFTISKRPTIQEIHSLYKSKKAVPSDVTKFFINRIKENDKKYNSFYAITEEHALNQSSECDLIMKDILSKANFEELFDKLTQEKPLFGVPYGIKAIIQVEGLEFNASSKILKGFKPAFSSTVYNKVTSSGAILVGINNMDEFAMGSSGENCAYGDIKNPFDTSRVPGGSSAGGASSVASGMAVFTLGTDTGGSIRQPAAFTDTVGLKPTYGLVSRWGVIPMASSFDQVGAFTNNVEDNIIVTSTIAGLDHSDQTTVNSDSTKDNLNELYNKKVKNTFRQLSKITKSKKPLKIGIPKEFFPSGNELANFDEQILLLLNKLKSKLESLGHELVEVSLPMSKHAVGVYYMTMGVEVASNLERIDGIRYAQQEKTDNLFFDHRSRFFGDESISRILLGTYASSSGYYDAYYNHAQKVREIARREFEEVLKTVDVLFTPTTPELPFKIGDKSKGKDPMKMYLSDVYTCGINPVRLPALNVPIGFVEEEGKMLPTGCQIIGKELSEDVIFGLALEIELLQKDKRVVGK